MKEFSKHPKSQLLKNREEVIRLELRLTDRAILPRSGNRLSYGNIA